MVQSHWFVYSNRRTSSDLSVFCTIDTCIDASMSFILILGCLGTTLNTKKLRPIEFWEINAWLHRIDTGPCKKALPKKDSPKTLGTRVSCKTGTGLGLGLGLGLDGQRARQA